MRFWRLTSALPFVLASSLFLIASVASAWPKFDLFRDRKMRNKVGAAFATGGSVSGGKEVTILTILGAMLLNQMIAVSGGGGFGASATTGPASPGIDEKELADARDLGKRVAEVAAVVKRGSGK